MYYHESNLKLVQMFMFTAEKHVKYEQGYNDISDIAKFCRVIRKTCNKSVYNVYGYNTLGYTGFTD